MDIASVLQKMPASPSVLIIRSTSGENPKRQYFVCVEKSILTECCDMPETVVTLIAAYFTFNMSYPLSLYSPYIFIQHHILGISDKQRVPNNATILFSAISKL